MSDVTLKKDTGEIENETESKTYVKWKIPDFFSLKPETDHWFKSPVFLFLDGLWCVYIYPNGQTKYNSFGWTGMYVKKVSPITVQHTVSCEIGILDKDDSTYVSFKFETTFIENEINWGTTKLVERSILLRDRNVVSPSGYVKFFCKLQGKTKDLEASKFLLERSALEKSDHPLMLLSRNFKDLLLSEKHSDVVLRVKDNEFKAHKTILKARSSVFEKMFEHDMLESRDGFVDITDFEPEVIRHVLFYVYSGECEGFSQENVCQLYKAADKYDLGKLKEKCAEYIEENVSVENVCDILLLADMLQEMKLKDTAEEFISKNKHKVLTSDTWKQFVEECKSIAYQTLESIMLHKTLK